jgi:rod shape-determining protein MreC
MRAVARHRTQILSVSATLFVVSVFFTAYSAKRPDLRDSISDVFENIISPFLFLGRTGSSWVGSFIEEYFFLTNVESENRKLRAIMGELPSLTTHLEEVERENSRLRRLLQMKESQKIQGVVATVIAHDASNWVESGTIDKGTRDGIKPGRAVIADGGVVGQVISVAFATSKVLFITDRSSGVDVLLQGSRGRGVLRGRGHQRLQLDYVDSTVKVEVGDRVITSGLDGVYPKGLLVGLVAQTSRAQDGLFLDIKIKPSVTLEKLEEVLVVDFVDLQEAIPSEVSNEAH